MHVYAKCDDRLLVLRRVPRGWVSRSTHRDRHQFEYTSRERLVDLCDWFRLDGFTCENVAMPQFVAREAALEHLERLIRTTGGFAESLVAGDPMLPPHEAAARGLQFLERAV
tara:strand:- start:378 stop:713 length:336 start_codon:yes stop_codon:yes gene_type:complete